MTAAAEKYNEPGRFTALIGLRVVLSTPNGNNLHRNVMFRDGKDKADQIIPLSYYDTVDPRTSGSGWRTTNRRPAAGCWRFRTTGTYRTG